MNNIRLDSKLGYLIDGAPAVSPDAEVEASGLKAVARTLEREGKELCRQAEVLRSAADRSFQSAREKRDRAHELLSGRVA